MSVGIHADNWRRQTNSEYETNDMKKERKTGRQTDTERKERRRKRQRGGGGI